MSPRDWGLTCAAGALAFDQGTKLVLLYGFHFIEMAPGARIPVFSFFDLAMVWNPGISYGLLPAHGILGTAVLVVFSVGAIAGLGWWLWSAGRRLLGVALGLVIGGALGNLIDRLIYGRVADFFHFHAGAYDWYVFNIADCAITLGVIALLYEALARPSAETADRECGRSE